MGLSHSHVIHKYVQTEDGVSLPADPFPGDVSLHAIEGLHVYSVLPFSMRGLEFILSHASYGSEHGDALIVPRSSIVPFFDALCDEGLRVV